MANFRKNEKYKDNIYYKGELRRYGHILDKSLNYEFWEKYRGRDAYKNCKELLRNIDDDQSLSDWIISLCTKYDIKNNDIFQESTNSFLSNNFENIDQLLDSRVSSRSFKTKNIEQDKLINIISKVTAAPSSCNRQTTFLYVSNDIDKNKVLLKQCKGATGFGDYIPVFITVTSDIRNYSFKDFHLPYIDSSLGVQSMILKAFSEGITCTILNWAPLNDQDEIFIRNIFNIKPYHKIIFNMVMGYPKELNCPLPKKSIKETFTLNEN